MASGGIVTYTNNPMRVNVAEWLRQHIGRFSIGKRINNREALIYAFSDNKGDIGTLGREARQRELATFRSESMKGITSIESVQD